MSGDAASKEARAYFALQGAAAPDTNRGNWRELVAEVLRSDGPLSMEFRESLATAIEGDLGGFGLGIRFDLVADGRVLKQRRDWFNGVRTRERWMEIGSWMNDFRNGGGRPTDALKLAAEKFGASEPTCRNALRYFNRAQAWLEKARSTPGFDIWGDEAISMFHHADAKRP